MQFAPIPRRDDERVAALNALKLLDTPREVVFDHITRLAAELLETPIALLSLVDSERQWFKSRVGTDLKQGDRCTSFRGHAILEDRIMVVRDAQRDERFGDNPWVSGDPNIRFYAGAPLHTREGHAIGTLCAIDSKPRIDFDARQARILRTLADIAIAQIELRQSANCVDTETGVYSKEQLIRVLQAEAQRAQTTGRDALLAVVDTALPRQMEDLTHVMGYDHAQAFVMESVRRIAEVIGNDRDIYRVGVSRFGFIIPQYEGPLTREQIETLTATLRLPVESGGVPIKPRATIGLTELHGTSETDAMEALRRGSIATDTATRDGQPWAFYDVAHNDEQHRRYRILSDLPAALEATDQLYLVYQPKIEIATGTCTSMEALLRWQHPELGAINPAEIVSAATATELMPQLTDWVLDTAVAQAASWARAGHAVRVAVNISARDAVNGALPERVADCLERHQLPPYLTEIEITESELIQNMEEAHPQLVRLRALGITIALDDFGAGYCNMHYLPELEADTIKLDRSFFQNLHRSGKHRSLAGSLIRMARTLGYDVVAEGVEHADTLAFATAHGCSYAQGFFFSAGKSPGELDGWLQPEKGETVALPAVEADIG